MSDNMMVLRKEIAKSSKLPSWGVVAEHFG